jgi:glycosyltransferase involved in cell wall biosynthesis
MDVCFLINQLAPGGAPTLLLDIVKHTDADTNIDYTVCFIEGDDTLVSDFEEAGARVIDFGAEFKFDPRALARMVWFFQREEFDVLHAHLPYSQMLGRVFGRLGSTERVISTQHNVPSERHPITRTLEQVTRPLDAATIAVAGDIERAFTGGVHRYEGHLHGQWCTIYNGIDVEGFNEQVRQANPTEFCARKEIEGDPLFLTVGRYVPAKAQHDLISAMGRLTDEHPDAHLLVVGWGELENELRHLVEKRDLTESVTITGRVPSEDIPEYYALADAFVSSSVREGLPIAILEAMAAGLPVIATKISGVQEAVENDETGLLVPPNSPGELDDAMIGAASAQESFGERGYDRVLNRFNVRRTVQLHVKLYHELTDRNLYNIDVCG